MSSIKNEVEDHWNKRERIAEMLKYLATFEHIDNMEYWRSGAAMANIQEELVGEFSFSELRKLLGEMDLELFSFV